MGRRLSLLIPPLSGGTNAQIAQLVEQLAFNQLVLGSNPSLRTFPLGAQFPSCALCLELFSRPFQPTG